MNAAPTKLSATKHHVSRWQVLQGVTVIIALLCLFRLMAIRESYDISMPRVPDVVHGRIIPVVITGKDPVYLSAQERQKWRFANYASWAAIIIFFGSLALRQYYIERKER